MYNKTTIDQEHYPAAHKIRHQYSNYTHHLPYSLSTTGQKKKKKKNGTPSRLFHQLRFPAI